MKRHKQEVNSFVVDTTTVATRSIDPIQTQQLAARTTLDSLIQKKRENGNHKK